MNAFRLTAAIFLTSLIGVAAAQTPGGADTRSSAPPGAATDGGRPSDGAINGGSILPGESGGLPGAGRSSNSSERSGRCNELSGTLRDDCLAKEQSSTGGTTKAPDSGGAKTAPSRDAPPPQNPR